MKALRVAGLGAAFVCLGAGAQDVPATDAWQFEFIPYLWFAHGGLELEEQVRMRDQRAGLDVCARANRDFLAGTFHTKIGSHATCAVAGDLRLTAVSIEQAGTNIRVLGGK